MGDETIADIEDGVQMQSGVANADYIITSDLHGFESTAIPAISPDDFCHRFIDDVNL